MAFGVASLLGVLLNVTVVPVLGWETMFFILGGMTIVAFTMLLFFKTEKEDFLPFVPEFGMGSKMFGSSKENKEESEKVN